METHSTDKGAGWRSWLAFLVGFFALQVVGWVIFPALLYGTKTQPLNFSHKAHVENAGVGCEDCHAFREDGTFAGIPNVAKCKECHESAVTESPAEATLISEYIAKNKEIPWLVYARQPDCVFFSHAAHVKLGQMECTICHGDHGKTDQLRPYQYNRITKYSRDIWGKYISGIYAFKKHPYDSMKMDDCGTCHKEQHVSNACFVCHK
ncbi:MAG: menaquinone reductase multiheme cytochrome c subunit QrcA [Pseudomonadota bacterium]